MQNVTLNTMQTGYTTGGVASKSQETSGLFSALMARLGQQYAGGTSTPTAASTASTASSTNTSAASQATSATTQAETPDTPIQRLKSSLEETGRDLEEFQVAAEDRDTLKEVLVLSGYSAEQADEIVDRASLDDGSVNLGAVFAVLDQYTLEGGVVLAINSADLPLLAQVLKELGLPQDEVQRFLNNQPRDGETVLVSGLEKLLAQAQTLAEARGQAPEVDADLVRDLLGKLGMSSGDIDVLMSRVGDSQGRLSPEQALALLQNAALTQDQAVKGALSKLAQRLKVNNAALEAVDDAERLRQQVMMALERREIAERQGAVSGTTLNQTSSAVTAQAVAAATESAGQESQASATGQSTASTLAQALQTATKEAGQQSQEATPDQLARAAKAGAEGQAVAGVKSAAGGKETAGDNAQGQAGGQTGGQGGAQTAGLAAGAAATGAETSNASATLAALNGVAQTAAATATTTSSSSVLPALVVRQVAEQIALMAKNGQSQLRLNLRPPELGGVNLKLSLEHGSLKATLTAESSAAKAALESGLDQLKQQLAQQGIRTERLDVALSPDAERREASGQGQGSSSGGSAGGSAGGGEAGGDDSEAAALAASLAGASGSSRINLFA